MKKLSAADIIETSDQQIIEVECPEWGGSVSLRSLTAGEAMTFVDAFKDNKKDGPVRLLVMTAVNEEGKPLFTLDDLEKLKGKSLKVLMRLQKAAMEMNGLGDQGKTEAKNG